MWHMSSLCSSHNDLLHLVQLLLYSSFALWEALLVILWSVGDTFSHSSHCGRNFWSSFALRYYWRIGSSLPWTIFLADILLRHLDISDDHLCLSFPKRMQYSRCNIELLDSTEELNIESSIHCKEVVSLFI